MPSLAFRERLECEVIMKEFDLAHRGDVPAALAPGGPGRYEIVRRGQFNVQVQTILQLCYCLKSTRGFGIEFEINVNGLITKTEEKRRSATREIHLAWPFRRSGELLHELLKRCAGDLPPHA